MDLFEFKFRFDFKKMKKSIKNERTAKFVEKKLKLKEKHQTKTTRIVKKNEKLSKSLKERKIRQNENNIQRLGSLESRA